MSGQVFRYRRNQPVTWFHRDPAKSNQHCLYCGSFVGKGSSISSNKEHLVGRDFVPTGTLDRGNKFNFIFRACESCNQEKSKIERHISSVTIFNSVARSESDEVNSIAARKGSKDYHPSKKGVLVQDTIEKHKLTFGENSRIRMSFELVSPPQPNEHYMPHLAFRHVQGIFSLITTKNPLEAAQTNLLTAHNYFYFAAINMADWGNPQVVAVIERTKDWACLANIDAADGFFKVTMKKNEGKNGEWFWALEWNKSYRVLGGIYHPDQTPPVFDDLPALNWQEVGIHDGANVRFREEIPLSEEQDILFKAQVGSGSV